MDKGHSQDYSHAKPSLSYPKKRTKKDGIKYKKTITVVMAHLSYTIYDATALIFQQFQQSLLKPAFR